MCRCSCFQQKFCYIICPMSCTHDFRDWHWTWIMIAAITFCLSGSDKLVNIPAFPSCHPLVLYQNFLEIHSTSNHPFLIPNFSCSLWRECSEALYGHFSFPFWTFSFLMDTDVLSCHGLLLWVSHLRNGQGHPLFLWCWDTKWMLLVSLFHW